MLSSNNRFSKKWQGGELKISENISRNLYSCSSGSESQTPSPLDGSFNGLLLFDDMDLKNLTDSFSRYDCGSEVAEPTNKHRTYHSKKYSRKTNKKNYLYIMNSNEDKLFNSPPRSILVCPEKEFTVIADTDLERPLPLPQKQRERAASVTSPPAHKLSIGRTRSNTICLNKSSRSEEKRRNRINSSGSDSSDCAYCKSIGKEYLGHSKQKCPRIELLDPCKLCGAFGYENHTVTHCPSSTKVYLKLDPSFSARLLEAQLARVL